MKEKHIRKNIFNILPNEIFIEILYNIKDLHDLINIYNCFKKYRKLIYYEINTYFKNIYLKDENHYLFILLSDIRHYLNEYISIDDINIKNMMLVNIDKIYNSHYIYEIIIKHYLICTKCNCKFNFYKYRHLYTCFICDNNFCRSCITKCYPCIPYNINSFYHCSECKNEYFKYIKEKLKKFDMSNKEDIKNLLILQYFINCNYSII